jgi:hypothetical protein
MLHCNMGASRYPPRPPVATAVCGSAAQSAYAPAHGSVASPIKGTATLTDAQTDELLKIETRHA